MALWPYILNDLSTNDTVHKMDLFVPLRPISLPLIPKSNANLQRIYI